jgi:hypothetical protein
MSLMPVASKIIVGACVVALSFWITLTLLDSTRSTDSSATENGASARRAIRLFDEQSSRVDNLAV